MVGDVKIDVVERFARVCGETSYLFGPRVTTGLDVRLPIVLNSLTAAYSGFDLRQPALMKG
jgi:hypothetical protein